MYSFLCRHLPVKWARVAAVIWYVALIVLTIAFTSVNTAEFRYGNI